MKNLVLDVNIVLDLWLCRGSPVRQALIANILAGTLPVGYQCSVSASSLHVLEYLARRALKQDGMPGPEAVVANRKLLASLLQRARPLSCFGFDQAAALTLGDDLEDAQIVLAAAQLQKDAAIVTGDKRFQTEAKVAQIHPEEVADWLATTPGASADFIDLKTQQDAIRPELERRIHHVLHHGQYIMGPEVRELEEKLANYVGVKHCVTASSGTDTLLIALMALGIGSGDEVITTPFTFIATGEMIALLGARPVFVDIDPHTYNIDPAKIEAAITPKTRAIVPVSLYGQCADFDAINAIADNHGLPVIEDGAQSFGATYKGRKSCGLSTIGSTSFFPSKPLGCYGDGGALFTDDDILAKAMREIRIHGQDRRYHHPRIGINGRLDTLQAAILLAKLDRFDEEIARRQKVSAGYTALISLLRGDVADEAIHAIHPPHIEPHNTSVYAQYTIQVDNRDAVASSLNKTGIPTAVHYPVPLHNQPAFAGFPQTPQPISERAAKRVMSLPMHPYLTTEQQQQIISVLKGLQRE